MKIKCIKDTEGYWTEGEMYPARQLWLAFSYLMQLPTPQSGQACRGYERALNASKTHLGQSSKGRN